MMPMTARTEQIDRFLVEHTHKQVRRVGRYKVSCSKCKGDLESHRIGIHCYCLACHAAYMRAHRPKHSDLLPAARAKANARAYANVYLNRGKIERKPCEVCGDEKAEMHHHDHGKPLEIVWLCRKHHLHLHKATA